jgi:uncharacterized protein (DUF697 family)
MPDIGKAPRGFGALGTVRNTISVLREVSITELREGAEREPAVLVIAPDEATAQELGGELAGPDAHRFPKVSSLFARAELLESYDAVVVYDPNGTGRAEELKRQARNEGPPRIFAYKGTGPRDAGALEALRSTIVRRLPDRAPAFGRFYPAFRNAAVKAVIDESARANAEFAFVSNIPAVIPVVGGLAAAGADFLVLTKNQVMLVLKIAAIYRQDLSSYAKILRELAPVVGAGFFWRTVAREAASFLPFAAGTVPKVAIAYSGTVVAGRAAEFYYRVGQKPSAIDVRGFYRDAAEAVAKLPLPKRGHDQPDQKNNSTAA